jgi:hypothetical protein
MRTRKLRYVHPEDGGDMFLRNVGSYNNYTVAHPKRQHQFLPSATLFPGARGSVVVKALCYKPEGRGFETR